MIEALLQLLWQQTLLLSLGVVLILALRRALLRRFGAEATYAGWLLLPVVLLAALLPASRATQSVQTVLGTLHLPARPGATSGTLPGDQTSITSLVLAALWLLGAMIYTVRVLLLQRRFMTGLRHQGGHWQSPAGTSPALVGLLRPRLCLPLDFAQRFDADARPLILAHEQVHRRRHDNRWNLLACTLCGLHWFNPLASLALRRMRADQELACDAAVLRANPDSGPRYARALMAAQGLAPAPELPWPSWQSIHPLIERIAMLKLHPLSRRQAGLRVLLALGLLSGSLVHALQADDAPDHQVEVKVDLKIDWRDSNNVLKTAKLSMADKLGKTMRVSIGRQAADQDDQATAAVELTVTDLGSERLRVDSRLLHGSPLQEFAKPWMIVKSGHHARIEIGSKTEGEFLALNITATLLRSEPTLKQ